MAAYIFWQGIENVTSITASSADADYPDDNLLDRNMHVYWKSGGSGNCTIDIEYPTTQKFTSLGLINNNFYSGSVTGITFFTTTTDTSAFSGTKEYHVGTGAVAEAPVAGDEPLWLAPFTENSTARKHWRLYILGADASTYLGTIILSDTLTFTQSYNRPRPLSNRYGHQLFTTSGGQRFSNLQHERRQGWQLKWSDANDTTRDNVVTFWEGTKGGHYPFVFKDIDAEIYWVRALGGNLPQTEDAHELWGFGLNLEEEL